MLLSSLDVVVGGEDESPPSIGQVIQWHRMFRRLTRPALGRSASISPKLLEKIERDERPVKPESLKMLLKALEIYSLVGSEYATLAFQPDSVRKWLQETANTFPEDHDLASLDAQHCPAALMTPGSCDLLATNVYFDEALPGARESGNLIKWLLFDERAREVLPHPYWEQETHLMVGGLHCLWPTLVTRRRLGELLNEVVDAPDFERFWTTPIPPDEVPSLIIQLRDLDGGITEHYRGTSQPDFPYQRRWRLYTLPPVRVPAQRRCTSRTHLL